MKASRYVALLGILCCLGFPVIAETSETIYLDSGKIRLGITSGNLETWQLESSGTKRNLSIGQENMGKVSIVSKTKTNVILNYPEKGLTVQIELKESDAHFSFTASKAQTVLWPRQNTSDFTALIYPMKDGRYIPLDNSEWLKDLEEDGEHNLWDGLALWGFEDKNGSIAWSTLEPFRSNLSLKNGILIMEQNFLCRKGDEKRTVSLRIAQEKKPLLAAELLRSRLEESGQFLLLSQKLDDKKRKQLLGSFHAYLWGDKAIAVEDVKPKAFGNLAKKILELSPVSKQVLASMDSESADAVAALVKDPWAGKYAQTQLVRGLDSALQHIDRTTLYKEYSLYLNPPNSWGEGISEASIMELKKLGIDKARLTLPGMNLTSDTKQAKASTLACAKAALDASFLFGVYDSYHSIHAQSTWGGEGSWETAQFTQDLYEKGSILKADGTYFTGFNGKGRLLSPIAARPYFEKRVQENLNTIPMNSYFVDCDAAAEIKEDYNPLHPSTSEEDSRSRLERLKWLTEKKGLIVGSEGGDMLMIAGIQVSEGLFGPLFTWEEAEYKQKNSPRYWGGFWPEEEPAVQFKSIELKDRSTRRYMDPIYRLPLFQAVFHDSVIITNHWSADPLKFAGMEKQQALFRALYVSPPSYNISRQRLQKDGTWMAREYAVMLPVFEKYGDAKMESFSYISADKLVQRCTYGGGLEVLVNFSKADFTFSGFVIPAQSAAFRQSTGKPIIFTP